MVNFGLLFGGFASLCGIIGVLWGYSRRQYHDVVVETPQEDIGDVDKPGVVQFEGEVTAVWDEDRQTVDAPFSDDECAVVGWHVEDWDETGDAESWTLVAEGYAAAPFEIDDGTGSISVEAGSGASDSTSGSGGRFANSVVVDDVDVDLGRFVPQYTVAPDEERPDAVRDFEQHTPAVSEQTGSITNVVDVGPAHGERRYSQATIQHGDDVFLLGPVESEDDSDAPTTFDPAAAVVSPEEDKPFILSVRSRDELIDRTRWGTPAMIAGTGLLLWGLFSLYTAIPFP